MQPHTLGNIAYEITNYLGNVNVVISDRKTYTSPVFKAVVLSYADYYPGACPTFRRRMLYDTWFSRTESLSGVNPEWSFSGTVGEISSRTLQSTYRYGYNGMECDDENKGSGNSYTTEFRQYDPRLGKWLSLDPMASSFPWQSPYCSFDNNPVFFTDPLGLAAKGGSGNPGDPEKTVEGKEVTFTHKMTPRERLKRMIYMLKEDIHNAVSKANQASRNYNITKNVKTIIEKNQTSFENTKGIYGGVVFYEEKGRKLEQINSTTIVEWGLNETPEYRFIYPSDLGTSRTLGSDGRYWLGCMSCHSPLGAYSYAAMNSQERLIGIITSSTVMEFAGGAFGSINSARTTTTVIPRAVGAAPKGFSTVLQSGGHTLNNSTLKVLGLTKEQGKIAIEALKNDLRLPANFHCKIMGNGDLVHPHTREVLGNLFDYLH